MEQLEIQKSIMFKRAVEAVNKALDGELKAPQRLAIRDADGDIHGVTVGPAEHTVKINPVGLLAEARRLILERGDPMTMKEVIEVCGLYDLVEATPLTPAEKEEMKLRTGSAGKLVEKEEEPEPEYFCTTEQFKEIFGDLDDQPDAVDAEPVEPIKIEKKPTAYAIYLNDEIQDVTLKESFAQKIVSQREGRTYAPLYDHPSTEVIRQFAAWLTDDDESESPAFYVNIAGDGEASLYGDRAEAIGNASPEAEETAVPLYRHPAPASGKLAAPAGSDNPHAMGLEWDDMTDYQKGVNDGFIMGYEEDIDQLREKLATHNTTPPVAVAGQGVKAELLQIATLQKLQGNATFGGNLKRIANEITVLPEPSKDVEFIVSDWSKAGNWIWKHHLEFAAALVAASQERVLVERIQ